MNGGHQWLLCKTFDFGGCCVYCSFLQQLFLCLEQSLACVTQCCGPGTPINTVYRWTHVRIIKDTRGVYLFFRTDAFHTRARYNWLFAVEQTTHLLEVLPKAGLVYSEKGNLSEVWLHKNMQHHVVPTNDTICLPRSHQDTNIIAPSNRSCANRRSYP